ncbi:MAG: calcium-binding protein [Microvirga sp.]
MDEFDWDTIYGVETIDTLYGLDTPDIIYGYGGDDSIYSGYGDDWIYGGYGADIIYGQVGSDVLYGEYGADVLYGGAGIDKLYGGSGRDDLYGGAGKDRIFGGTGADDIFGGAGSDRLSGGSGADTFHFTPGTSGLSPKTVDVITDWVGASDAIDMPVAGNFDNYGEASTTAISIAQAADEAATWFPDPSVQHVFLYNPYTDKGFLLSDLNGDGAFETGVVLNRAGYASDFDYFNIV